MYCICVIHACIGTYEEMADYQAEAAGISQATASQLAEPSADSTPPLPFQAPLGIVHEVYVPISVNNEDGNNVPTTTEQYYHNSRAS